MVGSQKVDKQNNLAFHPLGDPYGMDTPAYLEEGTYPSPVHGLDRCLQCFGTYLGLESHPCGPHLTGEDSQHPGKHPWWWNFCHDGFCVYGSCPCQGTYDVQYPLGLNPHHGRKPHHDQTRSQLTDGENHLSCYVRGGNDPAETFRGGNHP